MLGYQFELPVVITPALDTFSIGDTISIVSEFSDRVFERNTGDSILLENFEFFPVLGLKKIDSLVTPAIGNFEVINDIPEVFEANTVLGNFFCEYNYVNRIYTIRFKLIPLEEGIFSFEIGSPLPIINHGQDFPGRCSGERITANFIINNRENNYGLFQYTNDPYYYNLLFDQ